MKLTTSRGLAVKVPGGYKCPLCLTVFDGIDPLRSHVRSHRIPLVPGRTSSRNTHPPPHTLHSIDAVADTLAQLHIGGGEAPDLVDTVTDAQPELCDEGSTSVGDGHRPIDTTAMRLVGDDDRVVQQDGKTSWIDQTFEETFREFNLPLQFIRPWKFVVCTVDLCFSNLTIDELERHLQKHPRTKHRIPPSLSWALAAAGAYTLQSDLHSYLPRGIIAPIPYLKPDGIGQQCNHPGCSNLRFIGNKVLMDAHFAECHPGTLFREIYIQNVHCQQFRQPHALGGHQTKMAYFRVYPTLQQLDIRTEYGMLYLYLQQQETWTKPALRIPKSDYEISPWVKKIGWLKLMGNGDPMTMKTRIHPQHAPDWLQSLQTHFTDYIFVLESRMKTVSPIVFTWLTTDHDGDHNSVQIKNYGKNYGPPWTALIQLLVLERESPLADFPVPMSDELTTKVDDLAAILKIAHDPSTSSAAYASQGRNKGTAMHKAIHGLVFALLSTRHRDLGRDRTACPLARYIALDCLEMTAEGCRFLQPQQCRYKLYGFEYLLRICIVEEAFQGSSDLSPIDEGVRKLLPLVRPIQEGGPVSTWSNLQHTVELATFLGKAMSRPNVFWSEDSQELTYMDLHQKLAMSQIRKYIHDLIAEAKHILKVDVMRNVPLVEFSPFWNKIGSISDNITGSYPCLISHLSKDLPTQPCVPAQLLLKLLMAHCASAFYVRAPPSNATPACPIIWKSDAIRRWYADVQKLLQYYCAAVSFLVGVPMSSRYMLNQTIQPDPKAGVGSTIVIYQGHLAFLSNDATTTDLGARCQYVPHALGHEIMFYLVYVRPLEVFWLNEVGTTDPTDHARSLWVSSSGRWEEDNIGKLMEDLSVKHIEMKIGKRQWRDIVNAILEQHLGIKKNNKRPDNQVADLAAGHTTLVGDLNYAVGHSYSSSSGTARNSWNECKSWHDLWGFGTEKRDTIADLSALRRRFSAAATSLELLEAEE
ncbi:hypothetical protein DFH06DRAFT_1467476 [Mycena polygramma]|nr:hypothetical protein DFH06DRAFT_1467476 [Mycena polygramma]